MDRSWEGSWIEGVGDDAVYAVGAIFGVILPMIVIIFKRTNLDQVIHPENEENVRATREEVNHQRLNNLLPQPDEDAEQTLPAGTRLRPIRENHGQLDCPVCLGTAEYAIQTNCGHIFCGICITTYWQHGRWLGAVRCPVCRQTVTILLVNFTHDEHNSNSEDKRTIVDSIYEYNRRFSGEPRSWREHLRDLPTLLRHAVGEFFTVGGLIWMFRFRVLLCFLAAALYFVSPFDIIPEAVFGLLGFLDDIFVVLLLLIYVSLIYRRVVEQRAAMPQ